MEFVRAEIGQFGQLKDRSFEFKKGLNIVYGENEAGKSTLHSFLRAMIFGLSPQRGRSGPNDRYRLYEPWNNSTCYEGKLTIEHEKRTYHISRRFYKADRRIQIVEEQHAEEIDEEELLRRLGGITESGFLQTLCIDQMGIVTGETLGMELKEEIMNVASRNGEKWDIRRAFSFLYSQKQKFRQQMDSKVFEDLKNALAEKENTEKMIQDKNNQIEERKRAVRKLEEHLKENEKEREQDVSFLKRQKTGMVSRVIFFSIIFLLLFLNWNSYRGEIRILGAFLFSGCLLGNLFAYFFPVKDEIEESYKKKKGRIFLECSLEISEEIKRLKQEIIKENWELEKLSEQMFFFEKTIEELQGKVKQKERVKEELEALNLAEDHLKSVIREVQNKTGGKFEKKISEQMSRMTGGHHFKVHMDEEFNMMIDRDQKWIPPYKLSRGTMEQLYLALRISAADTIRKYQDMPLLLDDTFVYYDEKRLFQTLCALADEPRQILLFTCHKREETMLFEQEIPHHLIHMQKEESWEGNDIFADFV